MKKLHLKYRQKLRDIQDRGGVGVNGNDEKYTPFPDRPGSHLNLSIDEVSLEFIKYICQVLSLDYTISDNIRALKKNLLKMIDVKDFSTKSKFVNPCLTFVLTDVSCQFCRQTRDVDLCRDWHTAPKEYLEKIYKGNNHNNNSNNNNNSEGGGEEEDSSFNLRCRANNCARIYNKDVIESMLIQVVRRRETAYQMQDILCIQCGKAKMDQMSQNCNCSGTYKNKQSRKHFISNLKVFENIANYYGFNFLEDTVRWLIYGYH